MGLSPSAKIFLHKLRWFIYGKITSVCDRILFMLGISCSGVKNTDGAKIIVYVGESLPPRIARIAKWSKRLDKFTTVLLCHKQGFVAKFSNPDIDHTFLFRNEWHLKRLIKAIPKPYIIHGFAPKSKYPYIAKEAWKKMVKGTRSPSPPFVIDYQDVFAVYYGTTPKFPWLKEELPYEKACLAEADGIVANSLEPREAMKIWGINKSGKRMFFPLYADNDYFLNNKSGQGGNPAKKSFSLDDLHLVYVGGVFGSHRDKAHYGATQLHWLIDYLSEQKIHFHIYPSPSVIKADYEEYEEIAKHSTYFHYHEPVSQSNLAAELSKYHYGLMPFFADASSQSDLKIKYATTLKLFNYTEAGIPILVGADVAYQSWLVSRYSLGKSVAKKEDFKDVRKLIGTVPYDEQVKILMENREKLSLKQHTPRLLEFYKSLQMERG
jgi:hypothetical protein